MTHIPGHTATSPPDTRIIDEEDSGYGYGPIGDVIFGAFLRAGFSDAEAAFAVRVATGESGLRPGAVGDNGQSFGVFQLYSGGLLPAFDEWARRNRVTPNPFDVEQSARFVAEYIGANGPDAWDNWTVARNLRGQGVGPEGRSVADVDHFYEQQAFEREQLAAQKEEAEKARQFQLKLEKLGQAVRLQEKLADLQSVAATRGLEARQTAIEEMGRSPIRGAILGQGGISLGADPHARLRAELRGFAGQAGRFAELPIPAAEEANIPALGSLIEQYPRDFPQRPIGARHGASVRPGGTGFAMLVGADDDEVAQFNLDGSVEFIPLRGKAQYGATAQRFGQPATEERARQPYRRRAPTSYAPGIEYGTPENPDAKSGILTPFQLQQLRLFNPQGITEQQQFQLDEILRTGRMPGAPGGPVPGAGPGGGGAGTASAAATGFGAPATAGTAAGSEPLALASALAPMWDDLGFVPIGTRFPAAYGGMLGSPLEGRGLGFPTENLGGAAETFGALGTKPRLIYAYDPSGQQGATFLYVSPDGVVQTIGSGERTQQLGFNTTDAVMMTIPEAQQLGYSGAGPGNFPLPLEGSPLFDQAGEFAPMQPIFSPINEAESLGFYLKDPRLLASMWRYLDPDTKKYFTDAYGVANISEDRLNRVIGFNTPRGTANVLSPAFMD